MSETFSGSASGTIASGTYGGYSADQIKEIMANRGYPSLLVEAQLDQAISDALIDMRNLTPIIKMGTFSTVIGQSDYDVFSTADPAPDELVDSAGMRIVDIIWQPRLSAFSELNVFGFVPYFQNFQFSGLLDAAFTTPSDYTIFLNNLKEWNNRFMLGDAEQISSVAGAAVRLSPVPQGSSIALITYTVLRPNNEIANQSPEAYLTFVEKNLAETVSRMISMQAGLQLGSFKDLGKTVGFWQKEVDRLTAKGMSQLSNFMFDIGSPASRT